MKRYAGIIFGAFTTIALSSSSLLVSGFMVQPQSRPIQGLESALPFSNIAQQVQPKLDVPYVPTPTAVVDAMLKVANVGKNDILYDLGSGDGRIVITAARSFGTRGVGIDIDPDRVKEANANAKTAGVTNRVRFLQQDIFQADFREATVVSLYLLPEINLKLRPQLFRQLKPGTRVVSHAFSMGDWKPDKTLNVDGRDIYFWVIPQQVPANLR
jgi:2-polyprenyl-3-methyl-5-hydroxy-6-metoxy-1,4-benzoquinol methylase